MLSDLSKASLMAMHVVKPATYTPSQHVDHGRHILLLAHHTHDDKTVKRHNSHIAYGSKSTADLLTLLVMICCSLTAGTCMRQS